MISVSDSLSQVVWGEGVDDDDVEHEVGTSKAERFMVGIGVKSVAVGDKDVAVGVSNDGDGGIADAVGCDVGDVGSDAFGNVNVGKSSVVVVANSVVGEVCFFVLVGCLLVLLVGGI